jgi:hypothetical protein
MKPTLPSHWSWSSILVLELVAGRRAKPVEVLGGHQIGGRLANVIAVLGRQGQVGHAHGRQGQVVLGFEEFFECNGVLELEHGGARVAVSEPAVGTVFEPLVPGP